MRKPREEILGAFFAYKTTPLVKGGTYYDTVRI